MKRLLLLIPSILLLAQSAWGAVYCVDATGGLDTNTGTSAVGDCSDSQPWQTIGKINGATFQPGDSILFKRGETWTVRLVPPSSGSSGGGYITIGAYGSGVDPIISVSASSSALRLNGRAYMRVEHMILRCSYNVGNAIALNGSVDNIIISDVAVAGTNNGFGLSATVPATNVTINNLTTEADNARIGIYFYQTGNSNITITNHIALGGTGISIANTDGVTITGGSLITSGGGVVITGCQNVAISDTDVTGGKFEIDSSTNVAIVDSTTTNSNDDGFEINNSSGLTVSGCTSTDAAGSGFWLKGSTNTAIINDSYAISNNGDGFGTTDTAHDITFNRDTAVGNGTKTTTTEGDGFTAHSTNYNINVNYCLAYNNTASGFCMVGTSSGNIYNSIAYNNGGNWTGEGGADQIRGGFYFANSDINPTSGVGWVIINSIGVGNYPREILASSLETFDYNAYLPASEFALISSVSKTFSEWQASGQDTHGINADPRFRSTSDFRLLPSSPCINKGVSVGLTTDFLGHSLRGTPDIGAYEYWGTKDGGSFNDMNFSLGW